MKTKLCIGTAQFGFDYGITNKSGKVTSHEVSKILKIAEHNGIEFIDTAQSYGFSESVLGDTLSQNYKFKLINKIKPHNKKIFSKDDIEIFEENLQISLKKLKVKKIETLLLHSPKDLKLSESVRFKGWLLSLKSRNLIDKLGVSIYAKDDLIDIDKDFLEVVQLPLSLYDQRVLINDTLSELKKNGTEIYARSIYLQGLLVTESSKWPDWIEKKFKNKHVELEQFIYKNKLNFLTMALSFIKSIDTLDKVVVGICSANQLIELLKIWEKVTLINYDWSRWAIEEESFIDPRLWP